MNIIFAALIAAQAAASSAPENAVSITPAPAPQAAAIRRIAIDRTRLVIDDGDTLEYSFESHDGILSLDGTPGVMVMRLLAYDTPESSHPQHGIFYDQELGRQAGARLKELVAQALTLEAVTNGRPDKYGRLLGHLLLDGVPSGAILVGEGLAYETVSRYGDGGFSDESRLIKEAWETLSPVKKSLAAGQEPPFIDPHRWRKINQHHDMAVPLEKWNSLSEAAREELVRQARELAKKKAGKLPAPATF